MRSRGGGWIQSAPGVGPRHCPGVQGPGATPVASRDPPYQVAAKPASCPWACMGGGHRKEWGGRGFSAASSAPHKTPPLLSNRLLEPVLGKWCHTPPPLPAPMLPSPTLFLALLPALSSSPSSPRSSAALMGARHCCARAPCLVRPPQVLGAPSPTRSQWERGSRTARLSAVCPGPGAWLGRSCFHRWAGPSHGGAQVRMRGPGKARVAVQALPCAGFLQQKDQQGRSRTAAAGGCTWVRTECGLQNCVGLLAFRDLCSWSLAVTNVILPERLGLSWLSRCLLMAAGTTAASSLAGTRGLSQMRENVTEVACTGTHAAQGSLVCRGASKCGFGAGGKKGHRKHPPCL